MTGATQRISFGVNADAFVERDNLPFNPSALALAGPAYDAHSSPSNSASPLALAPDAALPRKAI
jgi:hypothetical protein